jgi:hypothetical protein
VPYGRRIIVPVSKADNAWEPTAFKAVVDAAHGKPAWSRKPTGGPGWWTQRRHIGRAATVLGLRASKRQSERVAGRLEVELATVANATRDYDAARGFRARARAAACVLDAVPVDRQVLERVLCAGWICGTWPRPWLWDGTTYRTFPAPERGAAPA